MNQAKCLKWVNPETVEDFSQTVDCFELLALLEGSHISVGTEWNVW